jgi:hypothetical protein
MPRSRARVSTYDRNRFVFIKKPPLSRFEKRAIIYLQMVFYHSGAAGARFYMGGTVKKKK